MNTTLWCSIGFLTLTGCQNLRQEVDLDGLTQQPNKLIVAAFISPQDTVLTVKVNRTRPIQDPYNATSGLVTNARVTLTNAGRSLTLVYNTTHQQYQADPARLPIRSGQTYTLTVQTPDGLRVSGSCTVPPAVPVQTVSLDSLEEVNGNKQYLVRLAWQDPPRTKNFYQPIGAFVYLRSCGTCSSAEKARQRPVRAPIPFGTSTNLSGLVSDDLRDGSVLTSEWGALRADSTDKARSTPNTVFRDYYARATVTAVLLHVDEAYYRYHTAAELAARYDGNPFAEPVIIPSNIKDGLGCFAAYNKSIRNVVLKR
ncbi:DUF4249 domain-containing protein [Fibrisoma montanum]|uniref:DUF4249 domain-containing protein n=1 Tax=Fibrisoma montanum TaxID=2305895 RepID=A0A418MAL5_9BACT|nr:DUF4249 domain-containing protein [Fibrisoma montanum]RIV23413.1 DUF4249 domain-containing protein [Fibrisoma montanum]